MPDRLPRPGDSTPSPDSSALVRVVAAALALRHTCWFVPLVEVVGEACRETLGGSEWRLLRIEESSGALRLGGRAHDGAIVLPEPGGVLEHLLRHERPILRPAVRGVPIDASVWSRPPAAVAGLPLAAVGRMYGILLVAIEGDASGLEPRLAAAGPIADQLALALERDALAQALEEQRQRVREIEGRASTGEQTMSELMAVVAHEIRTPLTSIKAYTEALIDAPAGEFERRKDFLGIIDDECDRLARLIYDALDLSRLEAGHRPLKMRQLDARAVVDDLALTLEPEAKRSQVELVNRVSADVTDVEGDPDLLKQLLLNLVGNAIKFSPPGTTVSVEAECEAEHWTLAVRDQGGGIPEEKLDKIFDRFYRIELKGGQRVAGTGLGLAIARHIVDLHAGRIWAENAPGGGSVFRVRLPRRPLAPESVRSVARELAHRADVGALLRAAVDMVGRTMEAEIVSILLVDPERGDLYVAAARGLDEQACARRLHYRAGVAGAAVLAGEALLVNNIETDRRFSRKNHPQYFTKSLLCAPIVVAGESVGVINVNNKATRADFDADDRTRLAELLPRLEGALARAHAYPDSGAVVTEAMRAMQSAARAKHSLLPSNEDRWRAARTVAARVGLGPSETEALLALLGEPHADDAAQAARAIVLARHERFDGGGRPRGLSGDRIPAGARVLAVFDAFDALTAGRPYRPATSVDEALAALAAESGRAYDGAVVDALAQALEERDGLDPRREAA
jgi:signal transduction histidine kinase/putative methionine-R-sulfoxide reductase with GAF domain